MAGSFDAPTEVDAAQYQRSTSAPSSQIVHECSTNVPLSVFVLVSDHLHGLPASPNASASTSQRSFSWDRNEKKQRDTFTHHNAVDQRISALLRHLLVATLTVH